MRESRQATETRLMEFQTANQLAINNAAQVNAAQFEKLMGMLSQQQPALPAADTAMSPLVCGLNFDR